MPSFVATVTPTSDLTKKGRQESVRWEDAQEKAFVTLRESLVHRPILCLPDCNKTCFAYQCVELWKIFPITYGSKKLSSAERKHFTIEKCLAIVWGVSKFRLYLAGKPFVLHTDHQPLSFLKDAKFQNNRIMQWALTLQEYDYTMKNIPGNDNVIANYLSHLVVDFENC